MPAAKPLEFRRRALDLACGGGDPVATIAVELGISESRLRRWRARDDVDHGRCEGVCPPMSGPSWSGRVVSSEPRGGADGDRDPQTILGVPR